MTLTEYSQKHNLCRKTAWNHFKRGLIRGAYQLPSGKITIPDEELPPNKTVVILFDGTIEEAKRRLGV